MLSLATILVTILALDSLYIGSQYNYFNKVFSGIQKSPLKINFIGAALCYIFLVFTLYYFILSKKKSILDAFILGICIYGIYDTTNYATFKDWPIYMVIIDILWGGILFSLTTAIYYKIHI